MYIVLKLRSLISYVYYYGKYKNVFLNLFYYSFVPNYSIILFNLSSTSVIIIIGTLYTALSL